MVEALTTPNVMLNESETSRIINAETFEEPNQRFFASLRMTTPLT